MYKIRAIVRNHTNLNPDNVKAGARHGLRLWFEAMRSYWVAPFPYRYIPQPPWTEKQRRFLGWAYRTGRLKMPPDAPTGALNAGWAIIMSDMGGRLVNRTTAARYVYGERDQSQYHHKRGRQKPSEMFTRHRGEMETLIRRGLIAGLRGELPYGTV